MLHDQEAVVILLQDGHELEAGESPAHIQFGDIAIQAAQDTGVVAANEEDFVPLQVEVAVDGIYQQLRRGDQDVECVFCRETAGCSSISMMRYWRFQGYEAAVRGANVMITKDKEDGQTSKLYLRIIVTGLSISWQRKTQIINKNLQSEESRPY